MFLIPSANPLLSQVFQLISFTSVGFQPVDAVSAWPDGDDVLRADIVDIETGGSPPHT